LEVLHDRLTEFLDSAAEAVSLAALINGGPEPYTQNFLVGCACADIRSHWYSSPVSLIIEADDWRTAHDS
jgi:hypothetical protein